ncbi:unnamed protein product [Prunus armeniaca]|uniref:Uncharacterized protein n=1 Tax=Prunus armeniaca TaxID=36596 RepID=A0A6J5V9I8_PRUAR|nr:unnamed protein product [Prunus armeniaca]
MVVTAVVVVMEMPMVTEVTVVVVMAVMVTEMAATPVVLMSLMTEMAAVVATLASLEEEEVLRRNGHEYDYIEVAAAEIESDWVS